MGYGQLGISKNSPTPQIYKIYITPVLSQRLNLGLNNVRIFVNGGCILLLILTLKSGIEILEKRIAGEKYASMCPSEC